MVRREPAIFQQKTKRFYINLSRAKAAFILRRTVPLRGTRIRARRQRACEKTGLKPGRASRPASVRLLGQTHIGTFGVADEGRRREDFLDRAGDMQFKSVT